MEARGSGPYEGQRNASFNMNINSPGNYESSGELSFSTMAQFYAPQNFNSRLGVGADDFNSEIVDIIESVNPVFEGAKGTGRKFRGGKLVKQKGCSTVAKGCQVRCRHFEPGRE